SHVITYSYTDVNGCTSSAQQTIVVNGLPVVTLSAAGPFCIDAAAVTLSASPSGGSFAGTGVNAVSGLFTPSVAGAGSHVITYSYTDVNGCTSSAQQTIVVNGLPVVTLSAAGPFCIDAAAVTLSASPSGGSFAGAGVNAVSGLFTPSVAGIGSHVITYTYTDVNGCMSSPQQTIVVNGLPVVTLSAAGPFCIDAAAVTLSASPSGGSFAGARVNAVSGLFTPSVAGAGSHVITYSYTDVNGCTSSAQQTIVVNGLPVVTLSAAGPFCIDAAAVTLS